MKAKWLFGKSNDNSPSSPNRVTPDRDQHVSQHVQHPSPSANSNVHFHTQSPMLAEDERREFQRIISQLENERDSTKELCQQYDQARMNAMENLSRKIAEEKFYSSCNLERKLLTEEVAMAKEENVKLQKKLDGVVSICRDVKQQHQASMIRKEENEAEQAKVIQCLQEKLNAAMGPKEVTNGDEMAELRKQLAIQSQEIIQLKEELKEMADTCKSGIAVMEGLQKDLEDLEEERRAAVSLNTELLYQIELLNPKKNTKEEPETIESSIEAQSQRI